MRILALVTDAFGGYGGIAVYNRDVLTALCENTAVEKVVAIPRLMPNPPEALPEKLSYLTDGIVGTRAFLQTVATTVLKKPPYSAVLCAHINLLPVAWLAAKWLRCPLVLQIYGIDAWQPTGRRFTDQLVKKADLVIAISNYTRQQFLRWSRIPDDKVRLLPNAIHLESYGEGSKPSRLLKRYGLTNKKVLLTFGRLVSHERAKGFDEVLDLMPELIREIPNLAYIIAGAGDYKTILEEKVKKLGLEDRVVFTGMVEEKEKMDLYRLADVYVMPSRGEGFGFVFLEAMACGIPVVASKVDGSRDAVMNGELGALVDPDDPRELKSAIMNALDKEKKIPEGLTYFSFENFSSRLNRLMNEVTQNAHG